MNSDLPYIYDDIKYIKSLARKIEIILKNESKNEPNKKQKLDIIEYQRTNSPKSINKRKRLN